MAAEYNNKYALKYTEEKATELFIKGLEFAENDKDCLCLSDAIYSTGIAYSTYDYLAEKYNVLGLIKKDTKTEIARRINKGALKGELQPASSIWRMKQLGEKDNSTVRNINFNNNREISSEDMKKAVDTLAEKENDF